MKTQKLSARDWITPSHEQYGSGNIGVSELAQSDFSPIFWMTTSSGSDGKRSPAVKRGSLGYLMIIGTCLFFVYFIS